MPREGAQHTEFQNGVAGRVLDVHVIPSGLVEATELVVFATVQNNPISGDQVIELQA